MRSIAATPQQAQALPQVKGLAAWLLGAGLLAASLANAHLWRRELKLARRHQVEPRPVAGQEAPLVSILLPAWNEAAQINACLDSITRLRYPRVETVVCAGGTDGTLEVARRYAGPRLIVIQQPPGLGKQRALQRCYEQASGEILFLTDADCVLDDAGFERVLAPLLDGSAVASTGSRRPLDRQLEHGLAAFQWAYHLYMEWTLPSEAPALYGINAAVRRDALDRAGAFTTPVAIGTDYHLYEQLRAAGYTVRFVRDSRVQTDYLTNTRAYIRQQARWFRNCLIHSRRRERLGLLRAGLAAIFLLGAPLASQRISLLWSAWLPLVWHLLLSLARSTALARRFGGLRLPLRQYALFPLYLVVSWVALARGLIEALLPRQRGRW